MGASSLSTSAYFNVSSPGVTTHPVAMLAWINKSSNAIGIICGLGQSGNSNSRRDLRVGDVSGNIYARPQHDSGGSAQASTSSVPPTSSWILVAALFMSDTYRAIRYASQAVSNTTSVTPIAAATDFRIGITFTNNAPLVGSVAEVALWDLTNWGVDDTARLAAFDLAFANLRDNGVSPGYYKTGLCGYWPLRYDARDYSGNARHLTTTGSPVISSTNHPTVSFMSPPRFTSSNLNRRIRGNLIR